MKPYFSALLAGVTAATFALAAAAQTAAVTSGKRPSAHPMDCAKAKDKVRCESLNKDIETCRDKTGDEWRVCMHQPASTAKFTAPKPRDCAKARNKERCEAHTSALETCKDKSIRSEHRQCMAAQLSGAGKG